MSADSETGVGVTITLTREADWWVVKDEETGVLTSSHD